MILCKIWNKMQENTQWFYKLFLMTWNARKHSRWFYMQENLETETVQCAFEAQ